MSTANRMRFLRYLAVGGLNTAFGFGMYALLLAVGLHYTVAVGLGTILGVLFNYVTTGRLVFGYSGAGAAPRFVAVYGVLYLVNITGIALLKQVGASDLLGGFLMLPVAALLGYLLNARLVFGSDRP